MYILTDKQYQIKAEPILRKIFVKDDPFDKSFSQNISERIIVYPRYVDLDAILVKALIEEAYAIGDKGCYLSQLWIFDDDCNHCYIPLSELLEFYTAYSEKAKDIDFKLDRNVEYVLYSETGKWGLMVSHEHHGILGGFPKFMQVFKSFFPSYDKQIYDWLKYFREEKERKTIYNLASLTLHWLPDLLAHIYGEETAVKMLEKAGLP